MCFDSENTLIAKPSSAEVGLVILHRRLRLSSSSRFVKDG